MKNNESIIFTDGASRGNPGPGGWGAVIVEGSDVKEIGGREDDTTNNRMEMTAVSEALKISGDNVVIYTDSQYVANGITSWIKGWKAKGWKTAGKTDVLNKDLWEKIDKRKEGKQIEMKVIGGHVGIPGNERCDEIATLFADEKDVELFDGKLSDYKVDILNFDKNEVAKSKKDRSNMKAYSYLSLVDGVFKKHETWSECETRVKGKSGVLYRKAVSEEDEAEIKKEWGVE